MKTFEIDGIEVGFWLDGDMLFCQVMGTFDDIYCCGTQKMPENEEEVLKVTEKAWAW